MNREELFSIIGELEFPPSQYAVFGGACLTANSIRDTNDLEIFVCNQLFQRLIDLGWEQRIAGSTGALYLTTTVSKIAVLAFETCGSEKWVPDVDAYIQNPELIEGWPFMPLAAMRDWKLATARPKDLLDVDLIDMHLARH